MARKPGWQSGGREMKLGRRQGQILKGLGCHMVFLYPDKRIYKLPEI